MIKKNLILVTFFSLLILFIIFKFATYFVLESRITYDDIRPEIKLSQLVNIPENRIKYSRNFYIDKKFIGFNAFIDGNYFITVTKLGKISEVYQLVKTNKKPDDDTSIVGIPPSVEDLNSRYYIMKLHPFKISKKIYYYIENGGVININQNQFSEIEAVFSSLNISFKGENRKDFGYVGLKRKKSISFITYKSNLYAISLNPIKNNQYMSLHDLCKADTFQR